MEHKHSLFKNALQGLLWTLFIGACMKAGSIILNMVMSFWNPKVAENVYSGMDLRSVYANKMFIFELLVGGIIVITLLQAVFLWTVIRLIKEIDPEKPFTRTCSEGLRSMSILSGLIGMLSNFLSGSVFLNWVDSTSIRAVLSHIGHGNVYIFFGLILWIVSYFMTKGNAWQDDQHLSV